MRQDSEPDSPPPTEQEVSGIFARYLALYEDSWSLYPDAMPCLEALTAYPLGLITNGDSSQQRRKLHSTGIADIFSSVVVSGDIGVAKPQREIFDRSAQELGISPRELLFIGDNPQADVLGAIQAGWQCIWLNRTGFEQAVAAATVTELTEVPNLIADGFTN